MADLLNNTKIGQTTLAQGVTGTVTLPSIAGTLIVNNSSSNSTGGLFDYNQSGGSGAAILVYSSVGRTISTASEVIVNCDTALFNYNTTVFTQSGGGVQVNVAGNYLISGKVSITAGAVTYRLGCTIRKNTDTTNDFHLNFICPIGYCRATGSIMLPLAANDVIYLTCFQNSGSNKTLESSINGNFLNMVKVG